MLGFDAFRELTSIGQIRCLEKEFIPSFIFYEFEI
jgi:hypothetical protein